MAIWSILQPFRIFSGYFVYFVNSLIFSPVLVCCTKKNLATLFQIPKAAKELLISSFSVLCTKSISGENRSYKEQKFLIFLGNNFRNSFLPGSSANYNGTGLPGGFYQAQNPEFW
jgi:hypothetical protein